MIGFKEFITELSDKTLNSYKKKAGKSIEKSSKKYDSNAEKSAQADKNAKVWSDKARNANYHDTRSAGKKAYPWDTYVGATSRANSEGVKSVKYAKKADEHGKVISKRAKGLSLANKRLKK